MYLDVHEVKSEQSSVTTKLNIDTDSNKHSRTKWN